MPVISIFKDIREEHLLFTTLFTIFIFLGTLIVVIIPLQNSTPTTSNSISANLTSLKEITIYGIELSLSMLFILLIRFTNRHETSKIASDMTLIFGIICEIIELFLFILA